MGVVDNIYFKDLAAKDPLDVCKRALCRYDYTRKCYVISAWGDEYGIFPDERRIDLIGGTIHKPHDFFYLFIVFFLLNSREITPVGEWISEKDLPGGPTFFRGPHEIPTGLISRRFGNDVEAFRSRCLALHGTPLDMGDAAYRFDIMPGIPVAALYWTGDDAASSHAASSHAAPSHAAPSHPASSQEFQFPPEAKLLYDKSISGQLPLDIVFALAVEICARVGEG